MIARQRYSRNGPSSRRSDRGSLADRAAAGSRSVRAECRPVMQASRLRPSSVRASRSRPGRAAPAGQGRSSVPSRHPRKGAAADRVGVRRDARRIETDELKRVSWGGRSARRTGSLNPEAVLGFRSFCRLRRRDCRCGALTAWPASTESFAKGSKETTGVFGARSQFKPHRNGARIRPGACPVSIAARRV